MGGGGVVLLLLLSLFFNKCNNTALYNTHHYRCLEQWQSKHHCRLVNATKCRRSGGQSTPQMSTAPQNAAPGEYYKEQLYYRNKTTAQ